MDGLCQEVTIEENMFLGRALFLKAGTRDTSLRQVPFGGSGVWLGFEIIHVTNLFFI